MNRKEGISDNFISILIFYILLYLYIVVSIINSAATVGGGFLSQVSGILIVMNCVLQVLFGKQKIPVLHVKLYNITKFFALYVCARIFFLFFQDSHMALLYIRNSVTMLFWVISLLFCIKYFSKASDKSLAIMNKILIVVGLAYFFYALFLQRNYFMAEDVIGASNAATSAYMLLPIIFLFSKRKMKILFYIICLLICAWSQKRQSLLGFGIISLFLIIDLIKTYFHAFKIMGIIYLIVALFCGTVIFNYLFSGVIERHEYLESKESVDNGREELRQLAIIGFKEASTVDKIFGGGPGTGGRYIESKTGMYIYPHCGYIEIMCDYGIIGFILYIFFFWRLFITAINYPRKTLSRKLLLAICVSWAFVSFYSHAGGIWFIFYSIAIGIIVNFDGIVFKKNNI